jgi:hypothetical protein
MSWKEKWSKKFDRVGLCTICDKKEIVRFIENLIAEERKKVAEDIISIIEGNGYNEWRTRDLKGLYAFTDEGLEQLKQKYGIKEWNR